MTDRDDHESTDDEQRSELGEVLDSLKRSPSDADDSSVSGGQTRMSWRSVTEETPDEPAAESPAPERSGFQFDLGSALQRLGGSEPDIAPPTPAPPAGDSAPPPDPVPTREPAARQEPAPEPLPTRQPQASAPAVPPVAEPLPTREPAARQEPAAEPLPTRQPQASAPAVPPVEAPLPTRDPVPGPQVTRGVHDAARLDEAARHLPTEPVRRSSGPAPSVFDDARPAPTLPSGTPTASSHAPSVPAAPQIPDVAGLPSLPAAAPAPPPVIEPLATATSATDVNAVRSVQMRAKRDERRGKVFGRAFLALVVLAAAVGGALVFGRSVLFPTQWDAGLTATVDAVQERRGAEFPSTVPLQVVPDAEYAGLALETWFGTGWSNAYADWRALGIATGDAASEAVVSAVVAWRPAFYDPLTDTVYRAESVTDEAAAPALRLALEEVFERQSGATPAAIDAPTIGVLSAGSPTARNARAIDRELLIGAAPTFTLEGAGAPLPLLIEMGVVDTFGDELVAVAADAGDDVVFGEPYPDVALNATAVDARRAISSLLPPDVEPAGDPVAWGADQWALVLDNRLPAPTVDRLVSLITADAYRPVTRGGTRCFVAQFQAASTDTSVELLGGLTRWAVGAPAAASASVMQLTPNTIELFACDPGAATEMPLDRTAVDAALARLALAPAG